MGVESEDRDWYPSQKMLLKLVAGCIFLPLIPLAVALNFLGTADQLSPLPGINRGSGILAGVVSAAYIAILIGVVTGGFIVASGGNFSVGDAEATPTDNPTGTPTPSPTSTSPSSLTSTSKPTQSEAELRRDYEEARQEFLDIWATIPKDHPSTPELLGADVHATQEELWIVFDETDVHDNSSRMRDEWTTVANTYLHVINNHTGTPPERMIAVGWNNTGPITHFRVETDNARARLNRNISYNTFYNRFFRTIRPTSEDERTIAREIAEHPPED